MELVRWFSKLKYLLCNPDIPHVNVKEKNRLHKVVL